MKTWWFRVNYVRIMVITFHATSTPIGAKQVPIIDWCQTSKNMGFLLGCFPFLRVVVERAFSANWMNHHLAFLFLFPVVPTSHHLLVVESLVPWKFESSRKSIISELGENKKDVTLCKNQQKCLIFLTFWFRVERRGSSEARTEGRKNTNFYF